MKLIQLFLFTIVLLTTRAVIAQDNQIVNYKHEIGTDMTSLFQKFLNFTSINNQSQSPDYQLTYKRHFSKFSIRAGIGGQSEGRRHESNLKDIDDDILKSGFTLINSRLGVEKNKSLGKRWTLFYGLDVRHQYNYSQEEGTNYLWGEYRVGVRNTINSFGLAPIIGCEFKISERLAIQTEGSFFIYFVKKNYKEFITTIVDNPLFQPIELNEIDSLEFRNEFYAPSFLVINFKF